MPMLALIVVGLNVLTGSFVARHSICSSQYSILTLVPSVRLGPIGVKMGEVVC